MQPEKRHTLSLGPSEAHSQDGREGKAIPSGDGGGCARRGAPSGAVLQPGAETMEAPGHRNVLTSP